VVVLPASDQDVPDASDDEQLPVNDHAKVTGSVEARLAVDTHVENLGCEFRVRQVACGDVTGFYVYLPDFAAGQDPSSLDENGGV